MTVATTFAVSPGMTWLGITERSDTLKLAGEGAGAGVVVAAVLVWGVAVVAVEDGAVAVAAGEPGG